MRKKKDVTLKLTQEGVWVWVCARAHATAKFSIELFLALTEFHTGWFLWYFFCAVEIWL